MKEKEIKFYGHILYHNDKFIDFSEFKKNISEDCHNDNDVKAPDYTSRYECSYCDNYLKIIISHGSAKPRQPEVFNLKKDKMEKNPRTSDQAELKTLFALIDFDNSFLWINNKKKGSSLIDFFNKKLPQPNLVIKSVFDEKLFIKHIKTVNNIKFSVVPNLFTNTNDLSEALGKDINGYGAHKAELTLSYEEKNPISKYLKDKIAHILDNKESFQEIVISGKNEDSVGILFNTNLISKQISFKASINDDGMFISDKVFDQLINQIAQINENRKNNKDNY